MRPGRVTPSAGRLRAPSRHHPGSGTLTPAMPRTAEPAPPPAARRQGRPRGGGRAQRTDGEGVPSPRSRPPATKRRCLTVRLFWRRWISRTGSGPP